MDDRLVTRLFTGLDVRLVEYGVVSDRLFVRLKCLASSATCIACTVASTRVHRKYWRRVEDLPCIGRRVTLELLVRRFRCENPDCHRITFSETLSGIAARSQRKSERLHRVVWHLGIALGGLPAARLAKQLNVAISGQSILRHLRRTAEHTVSQCGLRVIGIDDFAFRRGYRYGTIVVDHFTRRPIELFADRDAGTVGRWLQTHPSIRVMTRDRAGVYAEGIRAGAPEALHVADRWHLLKNLGDAIERVGARCQRDIRHVAGTLGIQPLDTHIETPPSTIGLDEPATERLKRDRRAKRIARYEQVVEHYGKCGSIRATARELGLDRRTVRIWIRNCAFPERAQRAPRTTLIDEHRDYLAERWSQGCHNAKTLFREIIDRGYKGGESTVRLAVKAWRDECSAMPTKSRTLRAPSTRRVCCWIQGNPRADPGPHDPRYVERFVDTLCDANRELRHTRSLARSFVEMFRRRRSEQLGTWVRRAIASGIAELRRFAQGLENDYDAVFAALTQPYSNGVVEGHVNRLKFIKRQMYGRASFDLLRLRVLNSV